MMGNNGRAQAVTATIAGSTAIVIWAVQLWSPHSFEPRQFQNVEPIHAEVVAVRTVEQSLRVHCRVTNHSPQNAEEIVLAARVMNQDGNVVAVNPLGSVSDLSPHATCDAEILVPLVVKLAHYKVEVDSTLVRWAD